MSNEQGAAVDEYGREAMAAFAHDLRTPLTAIRMVMDLARRQSPEGELRLDHELAEMFATSVDDLQRLDDDLRETSRLQRGTLTLSTGPCDLVAAVAAARSLAGNQVRINGQVPDGLEGPWDASALARVIAGFAETANRIGSGSGAVALACSLATDACTITLSSGEPGAAATPAIEPGFGFAFFRSRQAVIAMGGQVECTRGVHCATIAMALPLDRGDAEEV